MTRQEAAQFARDEMNKNGLQAWSIRLNQNADGHFLGLCSYKDKCIILNAHHIDIHPTPDVMNTIRHEIAHALCPGEGHNEVWADKARVVGCDNTLPCSTLSLSPIIIDAIRSGATVEVTFEEQVIRTPKYNITRLQDKCEVCGRVAKTLREVTTEFGLMPHDIKKIYLECGHVITKKIPKGTPFHTFQMGGDENCLHTWDKNKCLKCGRFRPFTYQIDGMRFGEAALAVNNGVGFFDEMGLGKTQQAGGVIKFHPELQPTLWTVKSGLKGQFAAFLIHWLGDDHVPQIITSSKDYLIPGLKHYIIGYDMMVPKVRQLKNGKTAVQGFDIAQFDRVGIKCVVLDECQQIKNVDSTRTQMVRRVVKGRKVIALSGTPWKNRGSELFPILNMLDYIKFHSEDAFKRRWVETHWEGRYQREGGIRNIPQFKELTKDIIIRRERTEVMPELPLVNRTKLYVRMTENQERDYDEAVEAFVQWYETEAANVSGMHILAMMARMRHLIALAKIPATMEYVHEFVEDTDRKLVIFVHHKDVSDILYDEIKTAYGGKNGMYIGHVTADSDKFTISQKFNSEKRGILVASQLASGEGFNWQTCSDCIMHERQWNPGNEEQAEGRFIRIGQEAESVNAIYTEAEGLSSIDTQIDAIVERKRAAFHATMNKSEAPKWSEASLGKELADAIVAGHKRKKGIKK